MLTCELRSQVDSIWNDFWSGGLANPLQVIEQITYLIFIKRGAGEAVGRPPGLGLRPLLNQPGFLDPDLPLMMSVPPGAARGPSSPTSVRSPHQHRPDRYRAHGS